MVTIPRRQGTEPGTPTASGEKTQLRKTYGTLILKKGNVDGKDFQRFKKWAGMFQTLQEKTNYAERVRDNLISDGGDFWEEVFALLDDISEERILLSVPDEKGEEEASPEASTEEVPSEATTEPTTESAGKRSRRH